MSQRLDGPQGLVEQGPYVSPFPVLTANAVSEAQTMDELVAAVAGEFGAALVSRVSRALDTYTDERNALDAVPEPPRDSTTSPTEPPSRTWPIWKGGM